MVARTKWRQHCSTCGKQFDAPQTWAYCSKGCEKDRRGLAALEAREDSIDEWLNPTFAERMDLREKLRIAMPWDRVKILEQITANEAREAKMRESLASSPVAAVEPRLTKPLLQRDTTAFWLPILRRETDRFELSLRKSLQTAIVLGQRLLEAKENLPHGEFGRLFRDHESPVEGALQFSASWARKLMAIGANDAITNRSHANDLPPDIETVYVLSRLPAAEIEAAIERGDVSPGMRRGDARDLLPSSEQEEPEPHDEVARVLDPVQRALRRFATARPSEFSELKARLKAALRAIEREIEDGRESAGTELMTGAERADMRP